jgi:hypothetical protein
MTTEFRNHGKTFAKLRQRYRKVLGWKTLLDQDVDEMRTHIIRLAETISEHVWGKRFY